MNVFVLTRSDITGKDELLISAHKTVDGAKAEGDKWAKEQSSDALNWYAAGGVTKKLRDESWKMLGDLATRLGRAAPVPPPFENPVPYPYWSASLDDRWLYCIDQRELLD